MKKVLIVGSKGMLGSDMMKLFKYKSYDTYGVTRQDFDITDILEVEEFFQDKIFDLVVNCAAYTKVDKAEEEQNLAFSVNATGAENLAKVTNKLQIPIVYISTDYVFDGTNNSPYKVTDLTKPINIYGKSKLDGEIATRQNNPKHYIVRTSWLYGQNGRNFVDTMVNLAKTRDLIKVVSNQYGCPTWTYNLAKDVEFLFNNDSRYGIYHLCGSQSCSWYEFAQKIFVVQDIDISVLPILSSEFSSLANRPEYSVMESKVSSDLVSDLMGYFNSIKTKKN